MFLFLKILSDAFLWQSKFQLYSVAHNLKAAGDGRFIKFYC